MSAHNNVNAVPNQNLQTAGTSAKAQKDPWAPIVLSLDGGGIKGLSELFILHKIMDRIGWMIDRDRTSGLANADPFSLIFPTGSHAGLLPCYFFDYMIGTSTGGLVAVMLGLLRMSTQESIKEFWCLGSDIFLPHRYIRSYSSEKLKNAIIRVVEKHSGCYESEPRGCQGDTELLRQYDYAEKNDVTYNESPHLQNFTCKTALVTQRKGEGTQHAYLFRTYNHAVRSERDNTELNPRSLGNSTLLIRQACLATSAAPYYFPLVTIGAHHYLDGGVGNNNPSNLAWNEALKMADPRGLRKEVIAAIVSLGCGEKEKGHLFGNPSSLFYLYQVAKYGKSKISETESAHDETKRSATAGEATYFRFSIKPIDGLRGHHGLAYIKLDECKKDRKDAKRKPTPGAVPDRPQWYTDLLAEAASKEEMGKKGGFKPEKYHYTTYETIFDRTMEYCEFKGQVENTKAEIDKCAELLLTYARARQADDAERWKCHVSHPNPDHKGFLQSNIRP